MTPMQKVEVLRAACCVAGIDKVVEDNELHLLAKMAKEVGVGKASLAAMVQRATSDPNFHQEQFRILKENPQECLAAVLEVALADGGVSEDETQILRSLSENLEVPSDVFEQLVTQIANLN